MGRHERTDDTAFTPPASYHSPKHDPFSVYGFCQFTRAREVIAHKDNIRRSVRCQDGKQIGDALDDVVSAMSLEIGGSGPEPGRHGSLCRQHSPGPL